MTNRNDILNELKELGSKLPVVPLENIYSVPNGYFEGFASQVLARIKAMEVADSKDELSYLSPYLSGLSKLNPYKVPAGYFENLKERLQSVLHVTTDFKNADEELERLSPLLKGLKKENPFTIPQGYFENLSAPVAAEETKTKVVSITSRQWFRLAAAAVVIGVVAVTGVLVIKNKTADPIAKIEKKAVKEINKASTEELNDFIQNTAAETGVAVADVKSDAEILDLLKDIPDEELNQFVNEIAEPETSATESILN